MKLHYACMVVFACSRSPSFPPSSSSNPDATQAQADAASQYPPIDAAMMATGPYSGTTIDPGVTASVSLINQGTAIGQGSGNGATPFMLTNLAADGSNTQTIVSATNPFAATGNVPDPAYGFCDYAGAAPKRISYVTGAKFEGSAATDPMRAMTPYYFPLVYTTPNTATANAVGSAAPIIGLFDWRPKDVDEALVAAESDDLGSTWYFMQTVLELSAGDAGCPADVHSTNAAGSADDGWGHAAIVQLPGTSAKTGQFLYMLDRSPANVDVAPLYAIALPQSSNKFPVWNTNNTDPGANDIKSIATTLANTAGTQMPVVAEQTVGLSNPDGIMAVFPTAANAPAGSPVTVMYVQKILDGDETMPASQQCKKAPFSGKTNHDVSNVRLASTTDGIHFTDLGVVAGLNDPTTVDYRGTRWISPRATLLDLKGDGSLWGMYFAGGNCLDGDSDAFHFIGYAESADMMHWTVYYDADHPIASINTITTANQSDGTMVTVPSTAPIVATEPWFAERLYAPTLVQQDATHLVMTFAGYGVQTPGDDLLDYRQIGHVALTMSRALATAPNNANTH
ncbi:MAG TPA: hypothetical protein VH143_24930 [Kofleriaceae bacterium]|jgi:hypothetical protein|nr:hypothetical protein [Kofleriaceae bacterium]